MKPPMTARHAVASDTLAALCRRHRIRQLSLFGSRLKGRERPDSDVDRLVEFEAGAVLTLLDIARIERELSALLGGHAVDVRTAADLSGLEHRLKPTANFRTVQ